MNSQETVAPTGPEALRDLVLSVLDDAKAQDVEVFDLRERNTFADFMIVACGTSTRQNKAMADRIQLRLKELGMAAPLGTEGREQGDWVLVDLTDIVVHLMLPQTRAFYNLEKLWHNIAQARPAQNQ